MTVFPFRISPFRLLLKRTRNQEVWLFTKRLRHLLASGLPEAEAVRAIVKAMPEGRFSRGATRVFRNLGLLSLTKLFWRFPGVLKKVLVKLESGCALSEAFGGFPKYFPAASVGIVAAGERSDDLPRALDLACESLRPSDVKVDRIWLGIAIPVTAVGVAYGLLRFLGYHVWPIIMGLGWEFDESGLWAGPDPFLSWVMLRFFETYTVALVAVLLLFGAMFLHPAMKSLSVYRFCLLMKVMLRANLSIEECRQFSSKLSLWPPYKRAVKRLFRKIEEGKDVAAAFASIRYFPAELKWVVAAGQCKDDIPGALSSAAGIFSDKSDAKFARLLDIGPPLLTILTAIPVGIVGIGVFSLFRWMAEWLLT